MTDDTVDPPVAPNLGLTSVIQPAGKVAHFTDAQSSIQLDEVPGQYDQQLSMELWVNPQSANTSDMIFAYGTGNTFLQLSNPNNLTVAYGDASLASGVALGTGSWRHIALTVTPAADGYLSITLLLDGALVLLASRGLNTSGDGPSTGETLYLGSTGRDGVTALQGLYAELRLWSQALPVGALQTQTNWRIAAGADGPNLAWTLASAPTDTTANAVSYVDDELQFRADTLSVSWTGAEDTTYNLRVYAEDYSWSQFYSGLTADNQTVTGFWFGPRRAGRAASRTGRRDIKLEYNRQYRAVPVATTAAQSEHQH